MAELGLIKHTKLIVGGIWPAPPYTHLCFLELNMYHMFYVVSLPLPSPSSSTTVTSFNLHKPVGTLTRYFTSFLTPLTWWLLPLHPSEDCLWGSLADSCGFGGLIAPKYNWSCTTQHSWKQKN